MPSYYNNNDFKDISEALKETQKKLANLDEAIKKAKEREALLRKLGSVKLADAEREKIRELENQRDSLTKTAESQAEMKSAEGLISEEKAWYEYLWDGSAKVAYEGGKIIVSVLNGVASGAVKSLTFGLIDPKLDALMKDSNTIAYKVGNIVGEVGAGIAALFINPIWGEGAAITTTGEVVQVSAALAKAIIAGSAAKAAVSDVIQFSSDTIHPQVAGRKAVILANSLTIPQTR